MRKFRRALARRLPLKLLWLLIVGLVFAFGLLVSRLLLAFGVKGFTLRDFIGVPLAYVFFFGVIRFFALFYHDEAAAAVSQLDDAELEAELEAKRDEELKPRPGAWGWLDTLDLALNLDVLLIIFLLVAGVLLLVEGPVILADLIFEFALSAGLLRSLTRHRARGPWYEGVLRKTIAAFLLYWVGSVVALAYLAANCPSHVRVSEALQAWRHHECAETMDK